MPRYNLPYFSPGRMPGASELQSLVETLRDILSRLGDDGINEAPTYDGYAGAQRYIATITNAGPGGEADFPDERYWVRLQRLANASGDAETASLVTTDDDTIDPVGQIVMATSLTEVNDGSHDIPVDEDTPVIVFPEHDGHGKVRWFFSYSARLPLGNRVGQGYFNVTDQTAAMTLPFFTNPG